ncbi:disulfide bond formation protein DsbA [Aeromicrobium sp. Root495]|uniref:MDR family MFS transporter n=1 Tax=Aeromicrobium sp. Root495 TaxID=1736550 RepID=UPI0006F9B11C|nr:MDR family MFS transporter [Aeromicrobium sp. Root495]KQY60330.1 disulfide bond formation protein DsbA [Aeromicrobium sp. Root495]
MQQKTSDSPVGDELASLAGTVDTVVDAPAASAELTHRQILEVLIGLLAGMFTALISSTIVSNALPTIIADLDGSQTQYTWVVTASLLTMTVSTPIWGKLSDLFNKKVLVQTALVIFVVGSVLAGAAQNVPWLIACRAVQGLAMGGLVATAQAIIGSIIPPRQRGRYSGYMGATMAVATVSGPLLGGVIVDTPGLGWRWCFYVCVPLAVMSLVVLQRYLHLETVRRHVQLDVWGAVWISVAASLPLLWVTFAGDSFDWISWTTAAYWAGTLVAVALVIWVESHHPEPLVPLHVVRERTTSLAIIGSIAVGISMFGGSVFLGQYFQVAGGHSPTVAGLLSIPLMTGSLVGTLVSGQLITRFGRWKRFLVLGSALLVVGLSLLSTVDHTTPEWHAMASMGVMGIGMGMLLQNYVLAVQNTVSVQTVGAASATVSFFRSLGGTVGVSVLGAILASDVKRTVSDQLGSSSSGGGGSLLDVKNLPPAAAEVVRGAYGDATGNIFLVAAIVSVVSLVAALAIKEIPLRTTVDRGPSED